MYEDVKETGSDIVNRLRAYGWSTEWPPALADSVSLSTVLEGKKNGSGGGMLLVKLVSIKLGRHFSVF